MTRLLQSGPPQLAARHTPASYLLNPTILRAAEPVEGRPSAGVLLVILPQRRYACDHLHREG
jgi:hypothetical protein